MFLSLEVSSNIVKDIVQNCKKTCNLCEEKEKQLDIIKKNDFRNRKQIVQKKTNYNVFNVYSSQAASNFSPSSSSFFSVHHIHHIFSSFIKEFFIIILYGIMMIVVLILHFYMTSIIIIFINKICDENYYC